jgi:hypothetical protein
MVHTGIIKEWTYCCPVSENAPDGRPDNILAVWIVIWHGIYAAYALDPLNAKQKMESINRLDLLAWLDRQQQEAQDWKSRYHALRRDLGEMSGASHRARCKEAKSD